MKKVEAIKMQLINSDYIYSLDGIENRGCNWEDMEVEIRMRDRYITQFGFPLLTKEWLDAIGEKYKTKRVLEVMAGRGFLSSMLKVRGVDIIATDDHSWADNASGNMLRTYKVWRHGFIDVTQMDAVEAVKVYHRGRPIDLVIMSWPPHNEPIGSKVAEVCAELGIDMLYIGESWGGCTADDDFFKLIEDYNYEMIYDDLFERFHGIYDLPYLIEFSKGKKNKEEDD